MAQAGRAREAHPPWQSCHAVVVVVSRASRAWSRKRHAAYPVCSGQADGDVAPRPGGATPRARAAPHLPPTHAPVSAPALRSRPPARPVSALLRAPVSALLRAPASALRTPNLGVVLRNPQQFTVPQHDPPHNQCPPPARACAPALGAAQITIHRTVTPSRSQPEPTEYAVAAYMAAFSTSRGVRLGSRGRLKITPLHQF